MVRHRISSQKDRRARSPLTHLLGNLSDDLRARVVVAVDTVTEAHEANLITKETRTKVSHEMHSNTQTAIEKTRADTKRACAVVLCSCSLENTSYCTSTSTVTEPELISGAILVRI